MEAARERGCTSAVFTFAPPRDRAVKGRAILTPEEKARRIAAMGVEHYEMCIRDRRDAARAEQER